MPVDHADAGRAATPRPATGKPLLDTLNGHPQAVPPIWLMRQAGRYLPEYRELRATADGFLDLCFTPEKAIEVTLQPIRRYGMDGAILFSDILVIPYALGQKLWFTEGVGPQLEPVRNPREAAERLSRERLHEILDPVYQTLRGVKADLPKETTLLGFAGAPWTVGSYMIEGGSSKDYFTAKQWMFQDPEGFGKLIELLVEATADYLCAQIDAGAEAVQVFDSWAGSLAPDDVERWSLQPLTRLVEKVKARHPDTPVILFPRGVGPLYTRFAEESGCQALGLDTGLPAAWARDNLQDKVAVQGNLDPLRVVAGGEGMRRAAREVLETLAGGPYVFNLGHGVVPQTPPEHVGELVELVRSHGRG
jgi:uroporphyrinogen decarboxylase